MSVFRRRQAAPAPNPWEDDALAEPREAAPNDEPVAAAAPQRRRAVPRQSRGVAAVGTMASGVMSIARLVLGVAVLIALLIGLAIVLRDVGANPHNTIVRGIHDGANFFAGAFTGLVTFQGHPKRAITVDWGIALLVYLAAGAILAAIVASFARRGLSWQRRHAGAMT